MGHRFPLRDRPLRLRRPRHPLAHVPNLGDVPELEPGPWESATLWSGGFPCQDLSMAGRRAGLAGDRSGLALGFLDLVDATALPPSSLENVPGLLFPIPAVTLGRSSVAWETSGMGGPTGYWTGPMFGVPQHRRRVFIVALLLGRGVGADRPAEVLGVGTWCPRHPPSGPGGGRSSDAPGGREIGVDIAGNLTHRYAKGVNTSADDGTIDLEAPPPDPVGGGAVDGVAGRVDPRPGLVHPLIPKDSMATDSGSSEMGS